MHRASSVQRILIYIACTIKPPKQNRTECDRMEAVSAMSTAGWSDEETLKLIEFWGDDRVQAELDGCKHNKQVYEGVSREMVRAGHKRTAEQCQDKAKKLKGDYSKVKDKHIKTGEGRNKWKFLEAMDSVLADKPSTQPPVLINTR